MTHGIKVVCSLWVNVESGLECVLWGDINGGVEEVDSFGRVCHFIFDGWVKWVEVLNK